MDPGLEQGLEQGLKKEKNLLARQIARRFGLSVSLVAREIIDPITNADILEEIGDQIIDCDNGAGFLQKLSEILG